MIVIYEPRKCISSGSSRQALTVISPIAVPRIGNQPVFGAIFDAPAHHLDSMATQHAATDMLVDACINTTRTFNKHLHITNYETSRTHILQFSFYVIRVTKRLEASTRFIGSEIRVDSECSLHRSVGHDLSLNLFLTLRHTVGTFSEMQIFAVRRFVAGFTLVTTLGRFALSTTRRSSSVGVMFTWCNFVRLTALKSNSKVHTCTSHICNKY